MKKQLYILALLVSSLSFAQVRITQNTDRQKIDSLALVGNELQIKIENDELKKLDLSGISGMGGSADGLGSNGDTGFFTITSPSTATLNENVVGLANMAHGSYGLLGYNSGGAPYSFGMETILQNIFTESDLALTTPNASDELFVRQATIPSNVNKITIQDILDLVNPNDISFTDTNGNIISDNVQEALEELGTFTSSGLAPYTVDLIEADRALTNADFNSRINHVTKGDHTLTIPSGLAPTDYAEYGTLSDAAKLTFKADDGVVLIGRDVDNLLLENGMIIDSTNHLKLKPFATDTIMVVGFFKKQSYISTPPNLYTDTSAASPENEANSIGYVTVANGATAISSTAITPSNGTYVIETTGDGDGCTIWIDNGTNITYEDGETYDISVDVWYHIAGADATPVTVLLATGEGWDNSTADPPGSSPDQWHTLTLSSVYTAANGDGGIQFYMDANFGDDPSDRMYFDNIIITKRAE